MDSRKLTYDQVWTLSRRIQGTITYLQKVLVRMDAQGFPVDDPLRLKFEDAIERMDVLLNLLKELRSKRLRIDNPFRLKQSPRSMRSSGDEPSGS